jgi:hypothetical protein
VLAAWPSTVAVKGTKARLRRSMSWSRSGSGLHVRSRYDVLRRRTLITLTILTIVSGTIWIASFIRLFGLDLSLDSRSSLEMSISMGSFNYVLYDHYYPDAEGMGLVPYGLFGGLDIGGSPPDFYVERLSSHMLRGGQGRPKYPRANMWRFEWWRRPNTLATRGFEFPIWILTFLLAAWPTYIVIKWFRTIPREDHCPACNYDLRGSAGSVTCPECGEAIPQPVTTDTQA